MSLGGVIRNAALAAAIFGGAGVAYVFVRVQVMASYPFYDGVYGNQTLFAGITYTVALELFGVLLAVSIFVGGFSKAGGTLSARVMKAAGATLLVIGLAIALVVYAETNLPWGNLLPGVHLWQGLPGGGGYPWGAEQVAYNTCYFASATKGDCDFLNYDGLFLIGLAAAVIGLVLRSVTSPGSVSGTPSYPNNIQTVAAVRSTGRSSLMDAMDLFRNCPSALLSDS